MDNIRTPNAVPETESPKSNRLPSYDNDEDDDFDGDYFEDEPMRKPKGKKIRKMRSTFDR